MSLNETISNLGDSIINLVDKKRHGTLGLEQGDVGYDKEVWADINKYKHSTFDINKFEVVGSPNITEDGIASGFSSGNYIKTINVDKLATDIEIKIKVRLGSDVVNSQRITAQAKINKTTPQLEVANGAFSLVYSEDGVNWGTTIRDVGTATPNTEYYFKIKQKSGTLSFEVSDDNIAYTVLGTRQTTALAVKDIISLGWDGDAQSSYFKGSIDLKQFSITVDGKEVFSGNKTGIDTIKPDNYTVVGSPTISEDGVLSSSNVRNYLKTTFKSSNLYNRSWEVITKFIIKGNANLVNPYNTFLTLGQSFSNFGGIRVWAHTPAKFIIEYTVKSVTGTSGEGNHGMRVTLSDFNVPILAKFTYDYPTKTYAGFYKRLGIDNDWQLAGTEFICTDTDPNPVATSYPDSVMLIGGATDGDMGIDNAEEDINHVKIYVDGKLVYQPCLKIPYTESKTGSKIVNEVYRDRVIDMYEQKGQAGYYTIQEGKKNNYNVVGSPTISADGVASGFSASNCINIPSLSLANKIWEVKLNVSFSRVLNDNYLFATVNITNKDHGFLFSIENLNGGLKCKLYASSNGIDWDILSGWTGSAILSLNTKYFIKVGYNGTAFYTALSTDDINYTQDIYAVSSNNVYENLTSPFRIGNWATYAPSLYASIDLNAFKIYVDGKLAYQTFTPPNYTLPMGDVYGVLSSKSNSSEIAGYMVPSNVYDELTLGESGAAYTAPANGWFYLNKNAGASGKWLRISSNCGAATFAATSTDNLEICSPVKKGDIIRVYYSATGDTNAFKFIYAEGSKGEKQ